MLYPPRIGPMAAEVNDRLTEALKKMPSRPASYVIHCMEGKDRTNYAKAFSTLLFSHGMSQQQLDALVQALTASDEH